jgi:tetratricopeptide (TPR) repeat protein
VRRTTDLLLAGFVAFAIRIGHAWFLSKTPFFEGPVIDAQTYRAFAERLAATGDFGGAFYQPPLYPTFLALLVRLGLGSAWKVAVVQSLLGAITAALMVLVGRELASDGTRARRVGLTAGLATALYGPLVLFDLELGPPPVVHLLLVSALLLALRQGKPGIADCALGLLSGAAITGWPLVAMLAPGLVALRARRLDAGRARMALLAVGFALLPLALTARHNAASGGGGVVVSYNSGINLWLGNSPHWRDTWRARPGARFEPELERPDREGVTKPGARAAYFERMVLRDVAAHPGAALGRTLEKFYYVWHGREIRRNEDIALLRDASPLLRVLIWEAAIFFPLGVVAPLALLGLWRRRREPDLRILALSLLGYSLVLAVFFVSSRYRLPVALLLLPLAADQAWHLVAGGRTRSAALSLLAIATIVNLPNDFTKSFAASAAERGILEAQAFRNQGKLEHAGAISENLVRSFPDDANVRMLRAEMLTSSGHCAEAVGHLRRVIELAPRATTPRVLLGTCLDELGDPAAAERAFAAALSLHPYHALALKNAGSMYARNGRAIEARALLTRFVKSGYDDPEVTRLLGEVTRAAHGARQ